MHRRHLMQTFNALKAIPELQVYQHEYLKKEAIILPKPKHSRQRKLLILDIDETMIHCLDENDPIEVSPEIVVRVPLDEDDLLDGEDFGDGYAEAGINIRPHLMELL